MTHGDQMNITNTAVVGVRPELRNLIAGHLSPDDQRAVFEWVSLNTAALVEYWEGRIDTIELGQQLKQIPSRQPGAPSAYRNLCPASGHQIDEGMAVAIDGEIYQDAYLAPLNPDSEIYLIPKIGGG